MEGFDSVVVMLFVAEQKAIAQILLFEKRDLIWYEIAIVLISKTELLHYSISEIFKFISFSILIFNFSVWVLLKFYFPQEVQFISAVNKWRADLAAY